MDFFILAIMAFFASLLTFFSGFGLGTILLPIFSIFFPVPMAIAMSAIVHFLNNLFKLGLTHKYIDWQIILRFGFPALVASFIGSYLLINITHIHTLMTYQIYDKTYSIGFLNLIIGILLLCFATMELMKFQTLHFKKPHLFFGGLLSGFFGGLSGFQGAFRSLFLINSNLTKESFIASGIAIACLVDVARIFTYSFAMEDILIENGWIILSTTLFAFLGAYAGNHFLHVATIPFLKIFIAVFIYFIAIAMILGLL